MKTETYVHRITILAIGLTAAASMFWLGVLKGRSTAVQASPHPAPLSLLKESSENRSTMHADFMPASALLIGTNRLLEESPSLLVELVRALHDKIQLVGLISKRSQAITIRKLLEDHGLSRDALKFAGASLDSMWIRDYGPLFLHRDNTTRLIDPSYSNIDSESERWRDDEFPILLSNMLGLELVQLPLRLEGGNLLSNGDGLAVGTSRLLRKNRSRGFDQEKIAAILRRDLGVETFSMIPELEGEPTGHVDMIMNFLDIDLAVVSQISPGVHEENAAKLDEFAMRLAAQTTSRGRMNVHRIPLPPRDPDGNWRTWSNTILINGNLMVPFYADVDPALQQSVYDTYRSLLPGWNIVPLPVDDLAPLRGYLRCFSLQLPEKIQKPYLNHIYLSEEQLVPIDRKPAAPGSS